jgi:PIN domain nuclease of toxin-antitoxin system
MIPRNVMWWALEKHKVPTKYITLIKDMYVNVVTSVRTSDDVKIDCTRGQLEPLSFLIW